MQKGLKLLSLCCGQCFCVTFTQNRWGLASPKSSEESVTLWKVLLQTDFFSTFLKSDFCVLFWIDPMLTVLFGGGEGLLWLSSVAAIVVGVPFLLLWGLRGEWEGWEVGGWGEIFCLYRVSVSWTQSRVRSCFCVQCELVFTADFDNSGTVLSCLCFWTI